MNASMTNARIAKMSRVEILTRLFGDDVPYYAAMATDDELRGMARSARNNKLNSRVKNNR